MEFITKGAEMSLATAVTNGNISNGVWHSLVMKKSASNLQLLVNNQIAIETTAMQQFLNSSSDLFIGGVPSESCD